MRQGTEAMLHVNECTVICKWNFLTTGVSVSQPLIQ
nr:MAG TPA: hypothetical protein [Caudoviricetes sp.]